MNATTAELNDDASADARATARAARLRYVTDSTPGIRRVRRGRGFSYTDPSGETIRDERELERIRALGIPPAWADVWICTSPNGHLQATGRDAAGRKQYRYHPRWREVRDEVKFDRMIAFGKALPAIRAKTNDHLGQRGLTREKMLAVVVKLLEATMIRVGNEEYVHQNGSFGLTTLRDNHVDITASKITFDFQGKSGKHHHISVHDPRLARVVRQSRDLPGEVLFQYRGDDGELHPISSDDVNAYLREITGEDFTAKDFRTWAGTVLAAIAFEEIGAFDDDIQGRHNVVSAIESVAARLGNTPTICRKCYVHPHVVDAYLEGSFIGTLKQRAERELKDSMDELRPAEAAVLAFLQTRLARDLAARPAAL
jgi:DNA topoisomerase I